MNSSYYQATTIYVLVLNCILALVLIGLLYISKAKQRTIVLTGCILFAYLILETWVIGGHYIFSPAISGTAFFFIILTGVGLTSITLHFTLERHFLSLPQEYILLTQGLRVFVSAGFFTEAALGIIPLGFGIMDGFMHALSAFTALFAATFAVKQSRFANTFIWIANIVGVTDILIIVTAICFSVWDFIGPSHNMQFVVFFGGIIFLWLHYISIYQLIKTKK